MAEFIRDGHFERHIREMRRTYLGRQQHLVAEARSHLGNRLRVEPSDAGMYLIGWLEDSYNDAQVARSIRAAGVDVVPLSGTAVEYPVAPGLLLGYSGVTPREISEGVHTIARVIDHLDTNSRTRE
jgi:GntR family transcriptional regulator/MocR family aminotransferase